MLKSKKTILGAILCALMVVCFSVGVFGLTSKAETAFATTEHDHSTWTKWGDDDNEQTSLPTEAGNYVLTRDVTLSSTWNVPAGTSTEPTITNLCLNGHVIKLESGETGSVVKVPEFATLNLYDCDTTTKYYFSKDATTGLWTLAEDQTTPTDYSVVGGCITGGVSLCGGGINVEKATLNMYGGNIVGNAASTSNNSDGGGIYLRGTLNMYGGSIIGNNAKHNGGGISMNNDEGNTVLNIYDGLIKDNTAAYIGGVCINGTFTMNDGTISDNCAIDQNQGTTGGVCVLNGAYFYMNGGKITNNTAIDLGGGVTVQGTFFMTGGEISGNTTGTVGGGIFVDGRQIVNSRFCLGGSAKITGNTAGVIGSKVTNNIHLDNGKTITIGTKTQSNDGNGVLAPTEDMNVGITLLNITGNFATGVSTADYLTCFTKDSTSNDIKLKTTANGNPATYTYSIVHEHEEDGIDFQAWNNSNSLPTDAGNWFLTCDITLSSIWNVPNGTTNLCLNGHVIKLESGATGSVIKVNENATLNLYDCGTTEHSGYVDSNGLWHYDSAGTHELLEGETEKLISGGIITGGNNNGEGGSTKNGGGVHVDKGEFNMYGGNIVGNYAFNGAGVYVGGSLDKTTTPKTLYNGTFNMYGGKIIYNTAKQLGGGVAIESDDKGKFTMTGGEITNNVVETRGGGVFAQSNITLGGSAKITGNTAKGATNNVYLLSTTNFSPKITLGTGTGEDGNGVAVPTNDMQIGITLASKVGQFTTAGTADDVAYFFSDSDSYKVCFNAGTEVEGGEYLELQAKTIADILPEDLLNNSNNKCNNENGYSVAYVNNSSLYFQDKSSPTICTNLPITTTLTQSDNNYKVTEGGLTFIFEMNSNVLVSITVSGASFDDLNGKYLVPHVHGNWAVTCGDNTITLTCGNVGCSETPYSVTLTLTASDEVFSEDANHKYSSASANWSDTELGLPQAVLKYYLVTDAKPVLTTNKNSGATKDEDGSAPRWAGNYIVKATITINETSYTIEKAFAITKAEINRVGFNSDKVEQPVATKQAKNPAFIFPTQTMYSGAISWSPTLLTGNKFDYNTVYTATVTLTANSNHKFKNGELETTYLVEGWTKSTDSTDSKLIYTKTFEKTGKIPQTVEITNDISKTYDKQAVSATTYTKLGDGTVTVEYKLASEDDDKYTTTAPINAGSYVVKVSVVESETHLSGYETAEFTISKAKVTVPTAKNNLTYDGTEQTGVTLPDNALFTLEDNTATNAGNYIAIATLSDKNNYEWNLDTPTSDNQEIEWSISPRELTVTIADKTSVYGDEIVELTAICDNLVAGDNASDLFRLETEATKTSDVGEYLIWATPSNNTNYNITFVGTSLDYPEYSTYTIAKREVTLAWGETTFTYDKTAKLPTATAGNLANGDEVTVTVSGEQTNAGDSYVATATALSNSNYKLPEIKTTNFVINKIDYDMTGVAFSDKTVKTTDDDADKKLAISGTLPTGLDGIGLTVSYVDNDNTARGVYTVTAKFSTTSTNYNVPSDMTAILTILWVRDSEKESGSDNELVIVTSDSGIDPLLTLKVDVVKLDKNNSQYQEVTDSIKKDNSYNPNLDKVFGVYDVSLIDQNNVKVQPDGTIKVYMTIPEEIKDCEFRIYHVREGVASKVEYAKENGYAVIETDELSEFVFVYEQTSLLPWIIILSVVSALGLAGIVLLLIKNKKDKQGRK